MTTHHTTPHHTTLHHTAHVTEHSYHLVAEVVPGPTPMLTHILYSAAIGKNDQSKRHKEQTF